MRLENEIIQFDCGQLSYLKLKQMKKKLIQLKEHDLKSITKKAKENDRTVNAEIRVAIKNHLKK